MINEIIIKTTGIRDLSLLPKRLKVVGASRSMEKRGISFIGKHMQGTKNLRPEILPSQSTTGYIAKVNKMDLIYKHLHILTHCSIIHSSQERQTTQASLTVTNVIHVYNGLLFKHKRKK